jgi:spore maturation protein CgeB
MEGTLVPNVHYVLIRDDYSDLESRLRYYIEHPDEAQQIIDNAHQYIEQFRNRRQEDLISLLVLKKYFQMTGQELSGLSS